VLNGGFAPYAVVREQIIYELPEWMSQEAGALAEPLACAYQAVMEQTTVRPGNVVLITGPGTMGLMCAVLSQRAGATVIVTGLASDQYRLDLARQMGIPHVVNAEEQGLDELVNDLTGGYGVDVALECAGSPGALNTVLKSTCALGSVTQVGLQGTLAEADIDQVVKKQLRFQGSMCHTGRTWDLLMQFFARERFDPTPFVTHRRPMSEWSEAFEDMENCRTLKTILYP